MRWERPDWPERFIADLPPSLIAPVQFLPSTWELHGLEEGYAEVEAVDAAAWLADRPDAPVSW